MTCSPLFVQETVHALTAGIGIFAQNMEHIPVKREQTIRRTSSTGSFILNRKVVLSNMLNIKTRLQVTIRAKIVVMTAIRNVFVLLLLIFIPPG